MDGGGSQGERIAYAHRCKERLSRQVFRSSLSLSLSVSAAGSAPVASRNEGHMLASDSDMHQLFLLLSLSFSCPSFFLCFTCGS